jgi:coenzyme F420-dependent glucose-6-phosphate dehydrogenase
MAAAAERTKRLVLGTGVTCPLFRYHPALVAQAFATMDEMSPGRIFLGLGTGEAIGEMPLGFKWPSLKERRERLEEAIQIIKALWTREFVTFSGRYYQLRSANLYNRPQNPIPIYVAAFGPKMAEIAGKYADGFMTTLIQEQHLREVLIPAVERGARSEGRDPRNIEHTVEISVTYDEDYDKALEAIRFWAATLVPVTFKFPIYDPREMEQIGRLVSDEALSKAFLIGTTPEEHIKKIEEAIHLGFTNIYLATTCPDENKFIQMYAKKVLPYIKSTYRGN